MNIISVVVSNSKTKIKDKICFSMGLSQASLCFNWISVSVFASPVSFSVIVSNANETWYAKVSRSFLTDELKIALTVTENSFSMGLFTKDGEYDYTRDLLSNSPKAIEWGEDLFRHHLKDARRLDTENLTLL